MTTNDVPEPVVALAEQMASFPAPWALCGGWAIDAWLGRETRDHGDIDISVFVQDQSMLYDHLRDWQLLAHDGGWQPSDNEEWWDGRPLLNHPAHIHGRPPERSGTMPERGIATAEDGFDLDIQIDLRSGGEWILSRDPLIALPLERAVAVSRWNLPTLVPEVLVFFKARDLRRRDRLDFETLLPQLDRARRDWLRDAIAQIPHPWLTRLTEQAEQEVVP